MDKSNPPTAFGVFKPVGHTVVALQTDALLQNAQTKLGEMGFAPSSMVRYSASEMESLVDAGLTEASPLAAFGYELDLLQQYKVLAAQGCSFLVVEAPTNELSSQVADWVQSVQPALAQHYGQFMIQNLTEKPPGRMGQNA